MSVTRNSGGHVLGSTGSIFVSDFSALVASIFVSDFSALVGSAIDRLCRKGSKRGVPYIRRFRRRLRQTFLAATSVGRFLTFVGRFLVPEHFRHVLLEPAKHLPVPFE